MLVSRGVTVHVFVPKMFSMVLSVQYACELNKYGVVLTMCGTEFETSSFIYLHFD